MATVYRAPEPAPDIDYRDWQKYEADEAAYIERMQIAARLGNAGKPLVGEIVRFPIADGYAQYIVWNTKPLTLVWLEVGDAWSIPDAHSRGLRLADVEAMVRYEQRWRKALA